MNQCPTSPISRPGSSDGSTTVSATSSPGIDQQEQEELNALYHQHQNQLQHNSAASLHAIQVAQQQTLPQTGHSVANGNDELTPRKRARKQQLGEYGVQSAKKFQTTMDIAIPIEQPCIPSSGQSSIVVNDTDINDGYPTTITNPTMVGDATNRNVASELINRVVKNNDENSPPKNVDCYIKRPKTCSLLDVSCVLKKKKKKKEND